MKLSISHWGLVFLFAAVGQLVFVLFALLTHPTFSLPRDLLFEDLVFFAMLDIPFCVGFAIAKTRLEELKE